MTMTGYSWTNPISSCGAITVVFASNSLATTADLKLSQTGSTWYVEPTDYGTVKDHTFSLKLQGNDNSGAAYDQTQGPYQLKVVCPTNVEVSETSPIL